MRFRLRTGIRLLRILIRRLESLSIEGDSMTSLDAVRARFAHNQGLPFADILTEASIWKFSTNMASRFGIECSARSRPSGDFSVRCSMKTIVAEMRYRGSSLTVPQMAIRLLAQYSQLLRCPGSYSHQMFSPLWLIANCRRIAIEHGRPMEMERSLGVHRRWLDRLDAGHAQKSTDVSSAANAGPGPRFSARPDRGAALLATGACHDLEIAVLPRQGYWREEPVPSACTIRSNLATSFSPTLYSTITSSRGNLCRRGIDIVARAQCERAGSRIAQSRP